LQEALNLDGKKMMRYVVVNIGGVSNCVSINQKGEFVEKFCH
jgi:hypothetical protein